MAALVTPNSGDVIQASHIAQLTGLVAGSSGRGQLVQLTQYSDVTNYANVLGNKDTTNGRALKILYGDTGGSPVTLATFQKSASVIQSNDGTDSISISNSGVAITGAFSVNGQTVGVGVRVYNVLDYGLVAGSSSTYAAANTTNLQALWSTVADDGGGTIYFPTGFWALNATTLNHANGSGSSATINILGAGGTTLLYFHGTTGPFLNVASSSDSPINYGYFRDFQMRHNDTVTSGATLQLGYVGNYKFENIRSIYNTTDKASATSVRLHSSASALKFVNCKFATRADASTLSGLVPIGLDVAISSGAPGGFEFVDTEFSGCQDHSVGIRWINTVSIDTVTFAGLCLVKDHETGMRFGFGNDNGGVANLIANGLTIDGITGQTLHYTPTYTGARPAVLAADIIKDGASSLINHQFVGSWFSGTDYIALLDNSGAGTLRGLQFVGCYLTGGGVRTVSTAGVMSELVFTGNRITCDATAAGEVALDIGDGSSALTDVVISGNRIAVSSASCDAVIRINAAVDSFTIVGNTLRSGADADGIINTPGAGTSKVVGNNSWKA